jgi:surface antigen
MANALGDLQIAQIKAQANTPATPAPATPAPAKPASDSSTWGIANPVISTGDLKAPGTNLMAESAKQGTFVNYDPVTGRASGRTALEVGKQGANQYLETPINGADYANDPDSYVVTHKDANTLYGIKKPKAEAKMEAPATPGAGATPGATSTGNPTLDWLNTFLSNQQSQIDNLLKTKEESAEEIASKNETVNAMKGELDQLRNELDYNQVLQTAGVAKTKEEYYSKKEGIEDRPISMTMMNRELNKLTNDTNISLDKEGIAAALTNATNTYRYNSKLIEYNVALGDLQSAQQMSQQTAQDIFNYQNQMLNVLQMQNTISYQDKQMQMQQNQLDFDRAAAGYIKISNPAALQELAVQKGTQWIEANTMKVGSDIYIKPQTVGEGAKWKEIGKDIYGNAQYGFVDEANQSVTPWGSKGVISADGTYGGQCGDYIHSIMSNTPKFGDTWQSKQAAMNTSTEAFKSAPQVGDIVAFKTNLPYGHVATVTAINPDGTFTVTESNINLDEKISNSRKISIDDPNILGAYRGATFKNVPASSQSNFTPEAMAYAQDILAGRMGIENVPGEKMKNQVILAKNELEKTQKPLADQLLAEGLQDKITGFTSLLNHPGMSATVGPYWFSRMTPFSIDKAAQQEFIASVEQLVQQETIDKLIQSKAAGATYGALSDGEREMLAKAASKIGSWRITKDGKVTGYAISEDAMKRELQTIRDLAQKARDRILGDSIILPPGQISDDDAYQLYINNSK